MLKMVENLWAVRGCKNRATPFPGRMSYKTKPGLVFFFISYDALIVSLLIRAPFYVLFILVGMCSVFWLFLLSLLAK